MINVNEEVRPSYYAIIPSEVRYCEELKFPERLLYGEITALSGKEGYCFAKNRYFAELYNVIPGTISRWVNHLEELGFIKTEIIRDDRGQITERRIYINVKQRDIVPNTYMQNKQYPYEQDCSYPYKQNGTYPMSRIAKDNNININIRIDRYFIYIIKNSGENPERLDEEKQNEFMKLLEHLEMNYTEDIIKIFTEDNLEKLKIIIFALKELFISNKKQLISNIKRERLITLYNNCREIQRQFEGTEKEIKSFYDYYYISLIKDLEKSKSF